MKHTKAGVLTTEVQLWLSELERKYHVEAQVCCWCEPGSGGGTALRVVATAAFPGRGVLEGRVITVEEAYWPSDPIELGAGFLRQAVRLDLEVAQDVQAKFWLRELER